VSPSRHIRGRPHVPATHQNRPTLFKSSRRAIKAQVRRVFQIASMWARLDEPKRIRRGERPVVHKWLPGVLRDWLRHIAAPAEKEMGRRPQVVRADCAGGGQRMLDEEER